MTVLANDDTGLARDDVFYFGNLIADVNGIVSNEGEFTVGGLDMQAILAAGYPTYDEGIHSPIDFNRDGACSGLDIQIILATYPEFGSPPPGGSWLQQITVPSVIAIDDFYAVQNSPPDSDQLKVDYTITTDPAWRKS